MSEEHGVDENGKRTDSFNRRSFVKAIGATGIAATGVSGIAAANKKPSINGRKASQEVVENALNAEKTQILLDEVGNPAVQRGRARELIPQDDEITLRLTTLPTQVGDIKYVETDSGADEASLSFGRSMFEDQKATIPPGQERQMRSRYRNLPEDFKAAINVGKDEQPIFSRLATSGEQEMLAETTGVSLDDLQATINTRAGVFIVRDTGGRVVQEQNVDPHTDAPVFNEVTKRNSRMQPLSLPSLPPR